MEDLELKELWAYSARVSEGKLPEPRHPGAKLRKDPCPLGLLGPPRTEPELSPGNHGTLGNRAPASCRRAYPHIHPKNAHFFGCPTWGAQNNRENVRGLPTPAVLGSPCPAPRSPGARPAPAAYKGCEASVRADPPRRLWALPNPHQSRGSMPPPPCCTPTP